MKMRQGIKGLLIPIVVVATLVCIYMLPAGRYFMKTFMNIFSYGLSDFKIYFLIVFYFITAVSWNFMPEKVGRRSLAVSLAVLAVCFALGMAEFIYLYLRLGIPVLLGEYAYFVGDGAFTGTVFTHIHNSKIVLAAVCRAIQHFFPQWQINADYGLPMLHYYPRGLAAAQLVLVLTGIFLIFRSLRHMRNSLPMGWFVVYFISAFIVLKNSVDGGILNRETMFALPVFLAVYHKQLISDQRRLFTLSLAYLAVCVALIWPLRLMNVPGEWNRAIIHGMALAALYTFICHALAPTRRQRIMSMVLLAAFVLLAARTGGAFFSPAPFNVIAQKGMRVQFISASDASKLPPGYELIEKYQTGGYFLFTVKNLNSKPASEIYQELGKMITNSRPSVEGVTWEADKEEIFAGIVLVDKDSAGQEPRAVSETHFDIQFTKAGDRKFFYYAKVRCGKQQFDAMLCYTLQAMGLDRFITYRTT